MNTSTNQDQLVGQPPREQSVTKTPRPSYDEPTHIARANASLHLWGDEESGEVADWVFVSSEKIHHLMFGLAPGQSFRHSQDFRTIFSADELLYVLQGEMVLSNPETGEVVRARTGEAVFFRRDTWHHAHSFGSDALRVVEFFAPPPASGASSAYARKQPFLETPTYVDSRWNGRWPEAQHERTSCATLQVLREDDLLLTLDGPGTLVGTYVSTEHLTTTKVRQRPGGRSLPRRHGGDAAIHVLSGTVNVLIHNASGQRWFEVPSGDGFYLPDGTEYELRNVTGEDVEALLAVAPAYSV